MPPPTSTTTGCCATLTPAGRGTTCARAATTATSSGASVSASPPPPTTSWCSALRLPARVLRDAGLAHEGARGGLIDTFRERVIFPVYDPSNRTIALGGRILPEELRQSERDPGPKYRNSAESPIYAKRRTLYGLNWAKAEVARTGEAVVCEGYTDVIGFFQAGVPRAVATCGTALTEDHFRLLARFCSRVVLAFDADSAGQNAAARLYEWERRHQLELAVADLPPGSDPAELAREDPAALAAAVAGARPYLGFRVERALRAADLSTPEGCTRAAEAAIAAIAEHPNELVQDQYVTRVADRTQHDPDRLRALSAETRKRVERGEPASRAPETNGREREGERRRGNEADYDPPPRDEPGAPAAIGGRDGAGRAGQREGPRTRKGRDALLLAIHRRSEVLERFDEVLFVDETQRAAFRALRQSSDLHEAMESAEPDAREMLVKLAASDVPADLDPDGILVELVRTATERTLRELDSQARVAAEAGDAVGQAAVAEASAWLAGQLQLLRDPVLQPGHPLYAIDAAERLVAWLLQRQLQSQRRLEG